jgi:anti-sigma factor RsiW
VDTRKKRRHETMIDCQKFLAEYSAYRDDELSWAEREAFEAHLDECDSCAHYDRVVRRGTDVFRDLPEIEVSEDFAARLQHRLYHVEEERRWAGRRASSGAATATFTLAAAVAVAAWVPLMRPSAPRPAALPAVAVQAPARESFLSRLVGTQHLEATGLTSRLARVGVSVREMPYHDVVFRPSGPLTTLAVYTEPAGAASPRRLAR